MRAIAEYVKLYTVKNGADKSAALISSVTKIETEEKNRTTGIVRMDVVINGAPLNVVMEARIEEGER